MTEKMMHSVETKTDAATLRTRLGRVMHNPSRQQIQAAIQDMKISDPGHCSASLSSPTGHTLTLFTDGRMTLTDSSQKDWIYELRVNSLASAVSLWTALADSDLETILSEQWDLQRADAIIADDLPNVFVHSAESAPMPAAPAPQPAHRLCNSCRQPMLKGWLATSAKPLLWMPGARPARAANDTSVAIPAFRCPTCGDLHILARDIQ